MDRPVGTLGTIPTVTVGGRVFTDLTNLKILSTSLAASSNKYAPLYDTTPGGTPGVYQVPGGKTFIIYAIKYRLEQASGGTSLAGGLFYGDTALADNDAGPLTNPVGAISGNAGITSNADLIFTDTWGTANPNLEMSIGGQVPTGKYLHIFQNTALGSHVTVYGYEV